MKQPMENAEPPEHRALRVLTGPHRGAEMEMSVGEYLVGSGDECDILLTDPGVAPRHLKLEVREDGCFVTPLEEAVHIDGRLVDAAGSPLELRQVVSAGTTHFGLAIQGEEWSDYVLPLLEQGPKPVAEASLDEDEGPSPEPLAGRTEGPAEKRRAPPKKAKRRSWAWAAIPAVLLVVLLAWGGSQVHRKRRDARPRLDRTLQAEKILSELGMDSLSARTLPGGKLVLEGYLESDREKALLAGRLEEEGLRVPLRVWTEEQLLRLARQVVKAYEADLTLDMTAPGVLRLQGVVEDHTLLSRLLSNLASDVPGIAHVETDVLTAEALVTQARQVIREKGLDLQVSNSVPGRLVLEGLVEDRRVLDEAIRAIREKVPGIKAIRAQATTMDEVVARIRKEVSSWNFQLSVEADGTGRVIVKGRADDKTRWEQLLKSLRNRFGQRILIEPDVWISDEALAEMKWILRAAALEKEIRLKAFPDRILVEGELPARDASRWESVVQAFREKLGERMKLDIRVRRERAEATLPENPDEMELTVQAVVVGNPSYIVNRNGARFQKGDELENGYVIQSIDKERIVLTKGAKTLAYRLNAAASMVVAGEGEATMPDRGPSEEGGPRRDRDPGSRRAARDPSFSGFQAGSGSSRATAGPPPADGGPGEEEEGPSADRPPGEHTAWFKAH